MDRFNNSKAGPDEGEVNANRKTRLHGGQTKAKAAGLLYGADLTKEELIDCLAEFAVEGTPVRQEPTGVHRESVADIWSGMSEMVKAAPGRIFYRICDLRAAMRATGVGNAEFDRQLRHLRDIGWIQLHTGDVTLETHEEARDDFIDENGFRRGTFTVKKEAA